jgi:hypothetical protein
LLPRAVTIVTWPPANPPETSNVLVVTCVAARRFRHLQPVVTQDHAVQRHLVQQVAHARDAKPMRPESSQRGARDAGGEQRERAQVRSASGSASAAPA